MPRTGPPTLYDTLGVAPEASADEVRRAYLARARRLHPDRVGHLDAGERAAAGRRMQELNEAWRVLGDPERRRQYDTSLRVVQMVAPAEPTAAPPEPEEPVDPLVHLIRALPWVLVLGVLMAIFVFTAYAGRGS